MQEIWKPIKGHEQRYHISNFGHVKSLKYKGRFGEYIMQGFPDKCGYPTVSLKKNGITKSLKIHRIVALNFIPNHKKLETVNHKNGIKSDNHVENLEWASRLQQSQHALKTGLLDSMIKKLHVLTFDDAEKIREEYKTGEWYMWQLAKKWDIGYGTVNALLNRRTYLNSDLLIIQRTISSTF